MMRAHLVKLLSLVLVGGVLALAVLVSDQYLPSLPQQPERLPAAVVTLGDSTLAGEGGGSYEAGTNGENDNWCHRSPAAPVHQLRLPPTVSRINLACSGARSELVSLQPTPGHAEGSQAQRLGELAHRYRVTDVVVQIGANDDPGFNDAVNRCVEAWASRSAGCAQEMRKSWPQRVERMKPKVVSALRDVRAVMDSAGYTQGSYSLVVQSYASPLGPGLPPELQNLSGCPFLTNDLTWMQNTGVPELSEGLRAAAQEAGARFLDLSRAGRGHEACTGGAKAAANEWFTRLTVDWEALRDEQRAPHALQESFHANTTGHAQLARCLGEFLASPSAHAVCLADDQGNLRAVPDHLAAQRAHP